MAKYIFKRILHSIVTLCVVICIVFVLLRQMPIEGYFNNYDKMSEAAVQVSLQKMGLTDPIPVQIVHYFGQLLHGDLGTSNKFRQGYPIAKIVAQKAPISIKLGLISLAVSLAAGLPLGIMMARSTKTRWKLWDKFGTVFIVIVEAVPSAVYHLLIQLYGSEILGVSMLFNVDNPKTWILPIFSLSIGNIAYYAMWLRRYMVDESNKDYIRLARAKGVPEGKISRSHVFRNAIVPLVQYLPQSILFTLMGSLYVESLYSIPGMGGLLIQVIKLQDNTMVQALVLIYAALSVLGLLFGDLMMALVDPRISFTGKEGAR
ncbi:ABC transporter permease [bacterium]|uniref:ABC transporter permease n=1 Tax=Gemmiger sp. TaxID=2049027 RepID=UPI002A83DE04|nr:ABC transporter permease [Gemmiger sp.]MCI5557014.1 ABC transporter permease [bacterium]MCI6083496.1 ABC transporter permease [bacterium]MCI6176173.1 ABC transporter permease [bacterium]MCI6249581.1 ABC transporter permease [bacterium]MCI6519786.1 ABC transporter permease [bacterium]